MVELPWPQCGDRRKEPRSNALTPWQLELARSLRGGRETIYFLQPANKPIEIYEWDQPVVL